MKYDKKIIPNAAGNAEGVVGEAALWEGPLSQVGRPHGRGSSSGKNGMQVLKYPSPYESKPITECAKKGRYNESY